MRLRLALIALIALGTPALAAPPSNITNTVGVCDPNAPQNCIAPNSDGSITVTGSISATNPSVAATGGAVPAQGTYVAGNKSGTLTGLTLDGSSNLNVNCATGCAASGSTYGAAFPAAGQAVGFSDGTNMQGGRVYDTDSGAGTEYTLGAQVRAAASGGSVAIGGDAANGLDVDVTRVTGNVTVVGTGTFAVQAAQSGAWTVSGTGTAGTAATGVVTVQGIASMTPVQVSQSGTWVLGANSGVDIGDVTVNNAAGASAVNIQDGGNSITIDGTVTVTDGAGSLNVIVDSGTLTTVSTVTSVTGITGGNTAHDAAAGAVNPLLSGCYASAAAPADVSLDNDATREWCLRNGARATVLTAAGALIGGDAANGIDVDVTRMAALVAGTANIGDVDILTFPDNEPINVAQMNGVAVTMGNGAAGTGVQRVTLANDSTGVLASITTSVTPGTAAANLGKAEDGAHTTGDVGVMSLALRRDTPTTLGADNDYAPLITDANGRAWVTGTGLSAVAVPPDIIYLGAAGDNSLAAGTAALLGLKTCTDTVAINTASSGNVELVALTASEQIFVCGYNVIASGTTSVQLIYGTGTACATGETDITGPYSLTAQAGISVMSPFYAGMKAAVSNALCVENSAAIQISGVVFYTKY